MATGSAATGMEIGLYTFAELTPDPKTGRTVSPARRLRDLMEEIALADEVGLDVVGVGEHHRPDFGVGAGRRAGRGGRAHPADPADERGDRADYDELFAQTLELLLAVREAERVSWPGGHRARIDDRGVYPRPVQEPLPVWVAVGGTPASAVRAGALGLPLALGIIGGEPARFAPFAELHRRAAEEVGGARPPLGINSHGHVADTSQRPR